ncbi:DUF1349 domain-containing protein [Catellatospora tritici]|uniref:DUF1349 domain-containing protein n=1 Tax=Catellatospora tritici TaxID=2851566 RepID=UPI001C2D3F21|nr:DUF1349 domain-containing protein [Catellatospora tritici]MBV1852709.1 DUF1349 domain-containing protein [Catellatospora tritici]
MHTPDESFAPALRAAWAAFARRGRVLALAAAALLVLLFALVPGLITHSSCSEGPVEVTCPTDPRDDAGRSVADVFWFGHRQLDGDGTVTARLTEMTGTITYPPPNHDQIVSGLVPWAKTGIIVKDGLRQGSPYAAIMLTGAHGVRMQDSYVNDTPGAPGGVSAAAPRWLRLTRSGDTITGYESADGTTWSRVGTARLPGLPATVEVGVFAASPSDLTLQEVGLGGHVGQARFTQAVGVFDHVAVDGRAAAGPWRSDSVGGMNHTDWEKYHHASGLVEIDDKLTVSGTGDIGPIGFEGGSDVEKALIGLFAGLIVVIVVAVRFAAAGSRRELAARAVVLGATVFTGALITAAIALPTGAWLLRRAGVDVLTVGVFTQVRVVVGAAVLAGAVAVFALGLGALVRRRWLAALAGIGVVVVPYLLGVVPFLPETVTAWLLRVTPAAGFAMLQTVHEYPQVISHYAPYAGYFPLPGWAGCAVLCAFTAAAYTLARPRTP